VEAVKAHPNMRNFLREAIARDSVFIYLMNAKLQFIESLLADLKVARS
jgi:hypothetical protein